MLVPRYYHVTDRIYAASIFEDGLQGSRGDVGLGFYVYASMSEAIAYAEKGGWYGRLKDPVLLLIEDTTLERVIDFSISSVATNGKSKEHFARWVQIFNDPDWGINVLNQWETWLRKNGARWETSSSITAAYVQRGGLNMDLTQHAKELLWPHLQELIIGKSMAENVALDQADEKNDCLVPYRTFLLALDAANESLTDPSWKASYDRLVHGSTEPSIQSQIRDHSAMFHTEARVTSRSWLRA